MFCTLSNRTHEKEKHSFQFIKNSKGKEIFPDYLDASSDQLVATLKSGLPKVRNEEGAHGQRPTPKETPSFVSGYALHLAAAKILLLAEIL